VEEVEEQEHCCSVVEEVHYEPELEEESGLQAEEEL